MPSTELGNIDPPVSGLAVVYPRLRATEQLTYQSIEQDFFAGLCV
jgi:hypothetical protein